MNISKIFVIMALALVVNPAFAQEIRTSDTPGMIVISGHGEVIAPPDQAIVTSGVITQGATAREALEANTKAMASLVNLIQSHGVLDKDIQTSGFNVQPQYVYDHKPAADGYQRSPRIAAYQVSNDVSVRIKDLDSLGIILDGMVREGANSINGISFSVGETNDFLDDARAQAFADAKRKADIGYS